VPHRAKIVDVALPLEPAFDSFARTLGRRSAEPGDGPYARGAVQDGDLQVDVRIRAALSDDLALLEPRHELRVVAVVGHRLPHLRETRVDDRPPAAGANRDARHREVVSLRRVRSNEASALGFAAFLCPGRPRQETYGTENGEHDERSTAGVHGFLCWTREDPLIWIRFDPRRFGEKKARPVPDIGRPRTGLCARNLDMDLGQREPRALLQKRSTPCSVTWSRWHPGPHLGRLPRPAPWCTSLRL
jgi:hypothetical protein